MSSIQSRIVDFVVGTSCLAYATGKPSGLVVGRGTAVPVQEANHPRIDVYVGPERTQAVGAWHGDPKERWVTLLLECRAVGVGISPDLALDPLKVWAEKRIYADETFGGIGAGISGWSTDQDTRQLDKTYGLATLAVEVRYITSRDDPESQT